MNDRAAGVNGGDPLVSVVTPVYNGERFLAECIESVLGQSHRSWEYIIVNNGSTDASLEIAESYARTDRRIRIYSNECTLPFKENWNRALRLIAPGSQYCKVLHADDWMYPDCLGGMVVVAEAHGSVGMVGSWVRRGEEVMCRWTDAPGVVIPGRQLARLSLLGAIPYLFGSPSSLLFRSDLVRAREQFYRSGFHGVLDQEVCYHFLQEHDFGYVPRALTFTRMHDDSLTTSAQRNNTWFAGKLSLVERYGPVFLSPEEHRRRREDFLRRYYSFLGKSLLRGRGRGFWQFHSRSLKGLGLPLYHTRLLRSAAAHAVQRLTRRGFMRRRG